MQYVQVHMPNSSLPADIRACALYGSFIRQLKCLFVCYGRTLSDASMLYFADVFYIYFFMAALVGKTAERIFTKLSHVVDIRCYLRTY